MKTCLFLAATLLSLDAGARPIDKGGPSGRDVRDRQSQRIASQNACTPSRPAGNPAWHLQHGMLKAPAHDLGTRIETVEGTWRSTWVRRGKTNVFDATWTSSAGNPTFKGVVLVETDGPTLVVSRCDIDGSGNTCVYRASIDSMPTAWTGSQTLVVNGQSSCTNTSHSMVYPFSARVVKQ